MAALAVARFGFGAAAGFGATVAGAVITRAVARRVVDAAGGADRMRPDPAGVAMIASAGPVLTVAGVERMRGVEVAMAGKMDCSYKLVTRDSGACQGSR